MEYYTQVCALAILAAILYFYSFRRKILIKTGTTYIQLVICTVICTLLDMLSIFVLQHQAEIGHEWLVDFVCKSYVAALCSVAVFGLRYLCADIYKTETQYKKAIFRISIMWLIMLTAIFALPIQVHYENGEPLYTEGPSTLATYASVAIIVLQIFFTTEKNRKYVNSSRRRAVYFWIFCWFVSAAIQFANPQMLIVSFGASVGVMVIYLALENPEGNLDRTTGFFNETALSLYAAQHFEEGKFFALICIRIESLHNHGRKLLLGNDALNEMYSYLESFERGDLFILDENEFILSFSEKSQANDALELIVERFNYGWGEKKNVILPSEFMFVPSSLEYEDWDQMSRTMHYTNYSLNTHDNISVVSAQFLQELEKEQEIEDLIRDAIENDRVEPFYQPIFSERNGRFVTAEALARIRKADGTIVPPGLFIPVAEKNGTIIKIGEIVFEKVCQLISREMLTERFNLKFIEVNLSTIQCTYENLADSFISIMNRTKVDPSWINLEITETGSVSSKNILLKNMKELMLYGVTFSLDDFGTGNSNLNYIMDMPVQIVKFDRELVNAYFENSRAKHIMVSSVNMLKQMGIDVVLEGVETKEQYEELKKLEVSYIQGYYFSKPIPKGDFINFLDNSESMLKRE